MYPGAHRRLCCDSVRANRAPVRHDPDLRGRTQDHAHHARHLLLQAGGKNIYIDPAQGSFDGLPPADLILITDIHGDHMSQPNIDKVKKEGTVIIGPRAVADKGCGNGYLVSYGARRFTSPAIPRRRRRCWR